MVDLKGQYNKIKSEIDNSIQEVLDSSAFINGAKVKEFSTQLAEYLNVKNVIPCGNGTDALQIAMMALGLKQGDEVIIPVHTYVATAEVIALLNLVPVFVDVYPDVFTIDINKIKEVITPKTKAIVPVHLYGQCADMESIIQIADEFNLFVIEDTAQALGAEFTFSNGEVKKAGTMGHIGTTSFFPSKNLGCYGDGGAIFVKNDELAQQCQMIANHGQSVKYHHDVVGCNSRLDTIQAAVLSCKLPHLDEYAASRNKVADYYDQAFLSSSVITTPKRFEKSTHVFHQYTIIVDISSNTDEDMNKRDEMKTKLAEIGVPSMVYYPIPLHLQKAYIKDISGENSFPITENLSQCVLSLPIHTEMTSQQMRFITDGVLSVVNELQVN